MIHLILESIAIGLIAGLVYGIFGGGSGLIMVPGYFYILSHHSPGNPYAMQIAIASCAAATVPLGILASYNQFQLKNIDFKIIKSCFPGMLVGTVIAITLSNSLPSHFLKQFFGIILLPLAYWLWTFQMDHEKARFWKVTTLWHYLRCGLIGLLWFLLGVAIFNVPYLHKCGIDIRRAIGSATVISLLFSFIAALLFIVTGLGKIPLSVSQWGYVNFHLFFFSSLLSMITGYIGSRLSHRLPQSLLKKFYAILIGFVGLLMLIH